MATLGFLKSYPSTLFVPPTELNKANANKEMFSGFANSYIKTIDNNMVAGLGKGDALKILQTCFENASGLL